MTAAAYLPSIAAATLLAAGARAQAGRLAAFATGEPEFRAVIPAGAGQVTNTAIMTALPLSLIAATTSSPLVTALSIPVYIAGAIDIDTFIIPNVVIYPGLLAAGAGAIAAGNTIPTILGAITAITLSLMGERFVATFGRGDTKLTLLIGLIGGPWAALVTLASAIVVASLIERRSEQAKLAFGPILAASMPIGIWLSRLLAA